MSSGGADGSQHQGGNENAGRNPAGKKFSNPCIPTRCRSSQLTVRSATGWVSHRKRRAANTTTTTTTTTTITTADSADPRDETIFGRAIASINDIISALVKLQQQLTQAETQLANERDEEQWRRDMEYLNSIPDTI